MRLRAGDPAEIGGYPVEARLGAGGMGTVFLGRTASGRAVAVKLIHQQFADDDEFRTRFRQEVAAARRVSGAFTAAVVDADTDGAHPWMATTYIKGPTLAERITGEGPLDGRQLRTLAIGLAEALRDIHRAGVVHRDLKPSNVVLSPDGPRVIDFGISRAAGHQTLTMTGRVIGTPPFMSPEQLQSPRDVGPSSDVFSLATLLVYAATGQGPFDADSPYMTAYQVVHEAPALAAVPAPLRAVVEPCLAKDGAGRPSADALLTRLRALPDDLTTPRERDSGEPGGARVAASGPGLDETTHRSRRRPRGAMAGLGRRWRRSLVVALAVVAIGSGVALLSSVNRDEGPGRPAGSDGSTAVAQAPPPGFHPWNRALHGGGGIQDEVRCVPSGDSVYCGGGGVLAARLRAADGKAVWQVPSPGVPVQGVHLVGVADGTVLGYRISADVTEPVQVVAVDAHNGHELWSAPLSTRSAAFTGRPQDAVLLGSEVLSVDESRSRIEARRARGGDLIWKARFPKGSECVPFATGSRLFALCAPEGEVESATVRHVSVRSLDTGSGALGDPVEVTGRLRPMGMAGDGSLVLLRAEGPATGEGGLDGFTQIVRVDPDGQSRSATAALGSYGHTNAGMRNGTLYFAGAEGRVTAVDPLTGAEKWTTQTGVESASGPVLADGMLYFSSASGRVAALDERGGRLRWTTEARYETPAAGEVDASPRVAVARGALVVAAGGNAVFGFETADPPGR
ncbi:PQQ-binding-like beta-propeller repeat protein [Streptomyces sp. NPDC050560]|uniref:protein kinase domain-containing protein n=1 Tax=Streptomyces sp. NPDC050560 TaxID=3365630 RepID=UPI0037961878